MKIKEVRQGVRAVFDWLRRVVIQPRDELNRFQRTVRFAYDLGKHGARQLRQDRAAQMAAALAYRTLFGLLPVLVVATVVARALMGPADFLNMAKRLLESLNLYEVNFNVVEDQPPAESETAQPNPTLGEWLEGIFGQAMQINLTAIGWIGLLIVIYSAIGLMVTIENSFNRICRAPEGRPWIARVLLYWFVLTISPVAIGLMFWFDNRVDSWIEALGALQSVLNFANFTWSFTVVWLLMIAVYTLVPNTPVSLRPSIIGALISAILLMGMTRLFGVYLDKAVSFTQLYGSLGLIPLFMFWVYVMWLAVLFGLEVASTLHSLRGRTLEELAERKPTSGMVDPAAVLGVMELAAERFARGETLSTDVIRERLGVAPALAQPILERLVEEGMIHRVERSDGEVYTLAQPPEKITAEQLLKIGFDIVDESSVPDRAGWLARLRAVQLEAAAGLTLEPRAEAG